MLHCMYVRVNAVSDNSMYLDTNCAFLICYIRGFQTVVRGLKGVCKGYGGGPRVCPENIRIQLYMT